ncbi:major facilitator superfamily domain-containing protein [Schizophyllum fasciatum]
MRVEEDSAPVHVSPALQREITRQEARIEQYGGDDVAPPQEKKLQPPPEDPNRVTWDGPDDQANPQNWTERRRWLITLVCSLMTVNVTFASSAPTSATLAIAMDLEVSREVAYLITTMFLLGYAIGPLFWGPGSELVGRRPIFVVAMILYTLFILGQSLAPNIQTLLVTRFFSGFFAVAPLTNCGGVIADIWSAAIRGKAVSLFTACVFLGPTIAPIASGFITESYLGWRWVFWIMFIFAGACTAVMLVALPETYAPVILAKKAHRLRKADPTRYADLYAEHDRQDWSLSGVIRRTLFRPFQMLFIEPILALVTLYLSLVYGVLYGMFGAIPVIFEQLHGFTISQNGLIFIGIGVGTSLGALTNYLMSRHYPKLIVRWRGFPPAEERLRGGMLGAPLLVVGIFWLGWAGNYPSVHWAVPAVATVAIGMAISLIFMSFLSYLVDTYLTYSASALSANTVVRSAVAAAFPLFIVQMFQQLTVKWAATLLGLIGLLLAPSPFLFYRYGPAIRARSTYAPCLDLKIAKELAEEKAAMGDEKV